MFMIFSNTSGPTCFGTSGTTVQNTITGLVTAGTVPQSRLDDAVRRILAVKCEMGLFDTTGVIDTAATGRVGSAAHRMLARQAVAKSMVVLKNNNNLLPLSKTATIGVAVIGETPYSEGMGDRTDLTISSTALTSPASNIVAPVMALKAAGLPVVVVLVAGRPLVLDPIMQYADAIVMAWLPGSEGAGVTDVLYGDVKPTGKLPMSWPKTMQEIPINYGDTTYDPLYAYGYGLTY